MSFDKALETVTELVDDFKTNENHYLNPSYSEADVRNDFINKFFIALGWDVRHETQKNPYEQEVWVEKPVQIAKAQKRADYSFSISPNYRTVKFFVEAKKPAHALENKDYYFQTARYGWNANTPIAVLTDFEEFHIIDCRFRPTIDDALNYKLKKFHYSDYADEEKFREIYYLFSREAISDNSIEKYAEALPKPRGKKAKGLKAVTQTIDDSFLEELDEIRNNLAKSFKKNNAHLSSQELTEATQRTIDRLVFIKFLEDKLIEPDHYVSEFGGRKKAWEDFLIDSRKLDAKYNGVVFKKSIIDSKSIIEPDDKTFSAICEELSHENTPYNFDAIPIHILGSIYERFLGKVVNATDKRVTIEEKPEVRKAGGVYYTPQYIVDYIVKNTVGKLIEGKTPKEIAKMRFADIACGSGSFLITVFERLLDYHKRWYINNPEQAKKDGCILVEGTYHLSLKQKTKILLNNVYGVDIDQQAVEVTQLSLYLKLLEDETTATANDSWVMFKEQLLPDLNKNIVCGNSLIGTDILNPTLPTGQAGSFLPFAKGEDENTSLPFVKGGIEGGLEELKLKPMDFETVFSEVMRNGGFDTIIGNPPYVRQELLGGMKSYFEKKYEVYHSIADLYSYFIEKAISLLNQGGYFSYIVANKWMRANYGMPLREWILKQNLIEIIDFGDLPVFNEASTYPCILRVHKNSTANEITTAIIDSLEFKDLNEVVKNYSFKIKRENLLPSGWNLVSNDKSNLLNKISEQGIPLVEYVDEKIFYGIKTGLNKAFVIDEETKERLIKDDPKSAEVIKPFLAGRDIKRYEPLIGENYLILFPKGMTNQNVGNHKDSINWLKKNFSAIKKHLLEFESEAKKRYDKGDYWWELRACDYYDEFKKPKIMLPDISLRGNFALDAEGGKYCVNTAYIIGNSEKYLLGILNSNLMTFYYGSISSTYRGGYLRYIYQYLAKLPIKQIEKQNETYIQLERLVDQMLEAKKQLQQAKTEGDKNYLQRKCETLDKQIDELVYKLYGLTEDEIKIVEGS
ncbi:MAG: Eco57I restriction-modification methylase domain-containing protein [bacterium]|nr:Eco57I restriction-modification methylase domain-containing protein [bacterium]